MANFQETRTQIGQLRQKYRLLSEEQYRLQQALALLDERIAAAGNPVDPQLQEQRKTIDAALTKTGDELRSLEHKLTATMGELYQDRTPADLLTGLDDVLPVLLLPLKVETRFVTVKSVGRDLPAAAVLDVSHIQPDLTPFFEQLLSGAAPVAVPTIADLRAQGFGSAASAIEKEIKRGVLAPGNGQWILQAADRKELWVRIFPDDIFLHAHEAALLEAEYEAGINYWQELWAAEKLYRQSSGEEQDNIRREGLQQAWTTLTYAFTAPRSKWIIGATQPGNYEGGATDFDKAPQFPTIQQKSASWTQPTRAFVLPDRFVVRLFQEGLVREFSGALIPPDLPLGLDPATDTFSETESDLELPERLRWLSDFEAAEKVGMAVRIPLTAAEFTAGFERLVVMGVKLSADEIQTKNLVEELFYNHQYKAGGCAFLAQGTATNQTAATDMAKEAAVRENAAFLQWSGAGISTPVEGRMSDGKRLSAAMGVNPAVFQKVVGNDEQEVEEAAAINELLWPATLGYFLQQFLFPLIGKSDEKQAREFFKKYVAGRGQLPVCRVDDQPYGILPTTAFSRWAYQAGSQNQEFSDRLWQRVLRVLDGQWAQMAQGVSHAGDGFTAGKKYSDRLLQLLGLHAGSVEFFVRTLVDPFFSEDVLQVPPDDQLDAPFWEVKKDLEAMNFYFERFETASRMFDLIFSREVRPLDGPLIDDLPLSEERKLQNLPNSEEHYLSWLSHSELTTALRNESHGMEQEDGLPVLYLLLRHAIVREYMNVAIALLQAAGKLSPVAEVDQEREEVQTLGTGHEYYLRTAVQMRWQHQVRQQVSDAYRDLISAGLTSQRITEFEQSIGHAFPFYDAGQFLRRTVDQAVRKLRGRLIPQPDAGNVRQAISDFVVDVEECIQVQVEQDLTNLSGEILVEPDKWKLLTEAYPEVSGAQSMVVFIDQQLQNPGSGPIFQHLREMKAALAMIRDLPTARLERLLVEHLDLCHYRLDAWMLGLVNQRLAEHREKTDGLYLGAYGYLEDLKPGTIPGFSVEEAAVKLLNDSGQLPNLNTVIAPVMHQTLLLKKGLTLDLWLKQAYLYLGQDSTTAIVKDLHSDQLIVQPPLDAVGEGFIHSPSLAHANTAAILRSGYATYRQGGSPPSLTDPFAVNLTSHRVRKALNYLEGIRNGQSLGALLGYQLERALYEYADQEPVNVDFVSRVPGYIHELREHFPLQTVEGAAVNNVFQVINGLELLQLFQQPPATAHWSANILTNCPLGHRQLIDTEISRLEESLDGLSDLLMAEGVFQMARGNPDRSAAALKVLNDGGMMDNPEIIDTPRSGFNFMQRVAVLSNAGSGAPGWPNNPSPLSQVQAALNHWLARQLPAPAQCGGSVLLPNGESFFWSLDQLGIQPLDLVLTLSKADPAQRNSAFGVRLMEFVRSRTGFDPEQIMPDLEKSTTELTVYDILPLLHCLAGLIQAARPLLPEDLFQPSGTSDAQQAANLQLGSSRNALQALLSGNGPFAIPALIAELESLLNGQHDPADLSTAVGSYFDLLLSAAAFGVSEALPQVARVPKTENLLALQIQSRHVLELLKRKLANALGHWNTVQAAAGPQAELEALQELGQELFGRSFRLFPAFQFTDPAVLAPRTALLDHTALEVAEWLQGTALVRKDLHAYQELCMLREAFSTADMDQGPAVFQLPELADQWIAQQLPAEKLPNGDTLSLALEVAGAFRPQDAMWGLVVDEWNEFIPNKTTTTGVSFNYNQPDAEAPQAMLLAVSPQQTGKWNWEDLMDTVVETMQLAKKRTVEPDQIKLTPLAHFLPAVIGPINEEALYPVVDFAKNIKLAAL